jgi:hypothetical protein
MNCKRHISLLDGGGSQSRLTLQPVTNCRRREMTSAVVRGKVRILKLGCNCAIEIVQLNALTATNLRYPKTLPTFQPIF